MVKVEKMEPGKSIGITMPLHFEKDLVGTISLLGHPKHVAVYKVGQGDDGAADCTGAPDAGEIAEAAINQ